MSSVFKASSFAAETACADRESEQIIPEKIKTAVLRADKARVAYLVMFRILVGGRPLLWPDTLLRRLNLTNEKNMANQKSFVSIIFSKGVDYHPGRCQATSWPDTGGSFSANGQRSTANASTSSQ
jgi:hypothetical protein